MTLKTLVLAMIAACPSEFHIQKPCRPVENCLFINSPPPIIMSDLVYHVPCRDIHSEKECQVQELESQSNEAKEKAAELRKEIAADKKCEDAKEAVEKAVNK